MTKISFFCGYIYMKERRGERNYPTRSWTQVSGVLNVQLDRKAKELGSLVWLSSAYSALVMVLCDSGSFEMDQLKLN